MAILQNYSLNGMESYPQELQNALESFAGFEEDEQLFLAGIRTKNIVLIRQFIRTRKAESIDINKPILGLPPLHATADANFIQASKLLLEEESDPNACDPETGNTVLYYARKMSAEHIKLFISHGVCVTDEILKDTIDYIPYYKRLDEEGNCLQAFVAAQQTMKASIILSDQKQLQNYPKTNLARSIFRREIGR